MARMNWDRVHRHRNVGPITSETSIDRFSSTYDESNYAFFDTADLMRTLFEMNPEARKEFCDAIEGTFRFGLGGDHVYALREVAAIASGRWDLPDGAASKRRQERFRIEALGSAIQRLSDEALQALTDAATRVGCRLSQAAAREVHARTSSRS